MTVVNVLAIIVTLPVPLFIKYVGLNFVSILFLLLSVGFTTSRLLGLRLSGRKAIVALTILVLAVNLYRQPNVPVAVIIIAWFITLFERAESNQWLDLALEEMKEDKKLTTSLDLAFDLDAIFESILKFDVHKNDKYTQQNLIRVRAKLWLRYFQSEKLTQFCISEANERMDRG